MSDASPYLVSWSKHALASARKLGQNLRTAAARLELTHALRELQLRLEQDPLNFGEVTAARGNIVRHVAVARYLRVAFTVDTQRKVVRVTECVLSGAGPVDQPTNSPT